MIVYIYLLYVCLCQCEYSIETLHKSLDILQYLPGHEERQQTRDSLSENLISALQTRVYADITGSDISVIQDYLYVYERLERFVTIVVI